MNHRLNAFACLLILLALFGCSQSGNKGNELPPIKIEIPAELKSHPELVNFIRESEDALNRYSQVIEDAAEALKPYTDKDFEELGMVAKMKVLGIMGQFAMDFAQFTIKYAEIIEKTNAYNQELTAEQLAAFAVVAEAFRARLDLIDKKFSELDDRNSI